MSEKPRKEEAKPAEAGKKPVQGKKGKNPSARPRDKKRSARGGKPRDRAAQQQAQRPSGPLLGDLIPPHVAEELKKRGLVKGTG